MKTMDWFLYDNGLRHERVKGSMLRSQMKIRVENLKLADDDVQLMRYNWCSIF